MPQIVKIERDFGLAADIETPDSHSYLFSSGIVSHNSMAGILSVKKEEKKEIAESVAIPRGVAPKRPKDLSCDIHVVTLKGQKFMALVGMLDGSLYEMFISEYKDEWAYAVGKKGIIRKRAKGAYDLVIPNGEDKVVVEDISKRFNHEYEGVARLVSTSLRHGVPLDFLVEQLSKSGGFGSWSKAFSSVLKKYIREGERVKSSITCSACGSTNLIYKEGCMSCADCGNSKCG